MRSNHRCNKRYFKRRALRWARSRGPSTPSLVQKVVLLLQILQTWISLVSFQNSSFKTIPYITRNTESIPLFKTKLHFFKNYFYPQLLSSGTTLSLTFEMSEALVFLKATSWIISSHPKWCFKCKNHQGIKLITRLSTVPCTMTKDIPLSAL